MLVWVVEAKYSILAPKVFELLALCSTPERCAQVILDHQAAHPEYDADDYRVSQRKVLD